MNNNTEVSKADGLVQKQFKMSEKANDKVFLYARILSGRWAADGKREEPSWADALEVIIETHPDLKNL
jgi:hypothetical protein